MTGGRERPAPTPAGYARVFVYGSLLPGMRNHGVIARYARGATEGRVRGRLVDAGAYPALLPDPSRTVRGLWVNVPLAAMPALDELEDFVGIEETNDYERVWTRDADDSAIRGWIYIWTEPRGYPALDSDYWPDVARRKGIEP